ncbi:MAG: hypothetical protein QXD77_01395, partial [Candidatus Aenigmatarchaeota archaeon]
MRGSSYAVNGNVKHMGRGENMARKADYNRKQSYHVQKLTKREIAIASTDNLLPYMFSVQAVLTHENARKKRTALQGMYRVYKELRRASSRMQDVIDTANGITDNKERAQYVVKTLLPAAVKHSKKHKELKEDFDRYQGFYKDCAGTSEPAALAAGLVAGLLVGGVITYALVHNDSGTGTNKPKKPPTCSCDKPYDTFTFDDVNGTIYKNGTLMKEADILDHVEKGLLFSADKLNDTKKFIEDNYKSTVLKFNKDGSITAHLENKDKSIIVENKVDAKKVHDQILPKLTDKCHDYALLPVTKLNGTEADFGFDDSMKSYVSGEVSDINGSDIMKIKYDGDGVMHAYLGAYDKDGNFSVRKELTEDQAKKIANGLVDNNEDLDEPVQKMFDSMKSNAVAQANSIYKSIEKKHDDFLKKYNVATDEELGTVIKYLQENVTALNDMIAEHNHTNLSGFDKMVHDLEAMKEKRAEFLAKYNLTDEKGVEKFISNLQNETAKLVRLYEKYGASDNKALEKMIDGFINASKEYDLFKQNLTEKYGIESETGLHQYISGLWTKIDDLVKQKEQMGAPFTVANITADANSTAVADYIRKAADRAGLDVFHLDLTNETQRAVARQVFGDSAVGRWLSDGIT